MAEYFIDFAGGSDAAAGTQIAPWKHCPGDANATGNAGAATLVGGDTVKFKGGVRYKGIIVANWAGTLGNQITYDGNNGWGTGKAILDGSVSLSMSVCTGNGTGAGQVPNANFASIYFGTLPGTADWKIPVFESDEWLDITSTAVTNPIPFFFEDTEYFTALASGITSTDCTDPAQFNQADSAYWVGSQMLVHIAGNSVGESEILTFTPGTDTVTYANIGTPINPSDWDGDYHYSVANNPRLIAQPGQYAVDVARGLIFVWPRADSAAITIGSLSIAFNTNGQSYLTIQGFVMQGHYSTGFVAGRAVSGSTGTTTNGVQVLNCDIKNHQAYGASGAVFLKGSGTTPNVVQNCTFDHIYGRGPFVAGNGSLVTGNTITFATETCIYSQGGSGDPNTNGIISNNTITDCRGVHQNGITVYGHALGGADNWQIYDNTILGFTQRFGNFGMSVQLHKNFIIYNNVVAADGGFAGDDLIAGGNYFRFYSNTFVVPTGSLGGQIPGVVRLFGLANSVTNVFQDNICNGLVIRDGGSASPIDWSRITHTNNAYTALSASQTAPNGWSFGVGEFQDTQANLLDVNLHLKTGSPAIGGGISLATYFTTDRDGLVRDDPWDIGAYASNVAPSTGVGILTSSGFLLQSEVPRNLLRNT